MGYNGSEQQRINGTLGFLKATEKSKQARVLRVATYNQNPILCKKCNTPLSYEQRLGENSFCSRKCAAGSRIHKPLVPRRSFKEAALCAWRIKKTLDMESWKQGKLIISDDRAKTLLIFEQGENCSQCGWAERNPFSNTIPIELEHVDGDCYNNKYENTKLLCPNCHALTPTFRGLNVGKGHGRKFYKLVSAWAKERRESAA